jgi:hypothetical protein
MVLASLFIGCGGSLQKKRGHTAGTAYFRRPAPADSTPPWSFNHRFVRDFKPYPGDRVEGFLLGEGPASVPDEYQDRKLIPVEPYTGGGDSYRVWLKLILRREGNGSSRSISQQVQPKMVRAEEAMA